MKVAIGLWWEACNHATLREIIVTLELFSSVSCVNISTNQVFNVDSLLLSNFLLFFLCWLRSRFDCWWLFWLLSSFLWGCTEQSKLFLIDNLANQASISPLKVLRHVLNFIAETCKFKVVFLLINSFSIILEELVNSILNHLFGNDNANTGSLVKVSLVDLDLGVVTSLFDLGFEVLNAFIDLLSASPLVFDYHFNDKWQVAVDKWLNLGSNSVE